MTDTADASDARRFHQPMTCQNPFCGKSFYPLRSSQGQYCSFACQGEGRSAKDPDAPRKAFSISEKVVALTKELAPHLLTVGVVRGPAMITADYHCPYIHISIMNRMLRAARALHIRTLVIGGDLFDMKYYSTHKKATASDSDVLGGIIHARELLESMLDDFDSIVIIPGNHDYWLVQHHEGRHSFDEWFSVYCQTLMKSGKLQVYAYPRLYVQDVNPDTGADEIFAVVHQRTYSGVNMAGVARDFEANRMEYRDCHVIVTHGHLEETSRSRPGHKHAISLPAMTDESRTAYPQMFPTRHRGWNVGFGIVTGGWCHIISDIMPDATFEGLCQGLTTILPHKKGRARK